MPLDQPSLLSRHGLLIVSSIDWSKIANECGPSIGAQLRGVLKLTNLGFYALFVPNVERVRVEIEMAHAYLPILGEAVWTREDGTQTFVAVVKAENTDTLRVIARYVDVVT